MNQAELIDTIAGHIDMTKASVKAVLDGLAETVQAELAIDGEVVLPGIGKLSVSQRAARTGRNPQTGEEIKIAAKKAPKFSAAKALKDAVNGLTKKGRKK